MSITPLEAAAIAAALRSRSALRKALPRVLARLRAEIGQLVDNDERQPFDCPLLEGERCLVHRDAKPIGCLGWHPPPEGVESRASSYTAAGWEALRRRNALNDEAYGGDWTERPIPLALERALATELGAEDPKER